MDPDPYGYDDAPPSTLEIVEGLLHRAGVLPGDYRLTPRGMAAAIGLVAVVVLLILYLLAGALFGGDEDPASTTLEPSSAATETSSTIGSELTVVEAFDATATIYGPGLEGGVTADGSAFDANAATAAHPTLEFGTLVRVTNPTNGLQTTVEINDRLPEDDPTRIDLTVGAASAIGFTTEVGRMTVGLEVLAAA